MEKCIPCNRYTESMSHENIKQEANKINTLWSVKNFHHLERKFKFKNFKQAMIFAQKICDLSEQEGHHPNLNIKWGECFITIFTHNVDGLTKNDFLLAYKIDQLSN